MYYFKLTLCRCCHQQEYGLLNRVPGVIIEGFHPKWYKSKLEIHLSVIQKYSLPCRGSFWRTTRHFQKLDVSFNWGGGGELDIGKVSLLHCLKMLLCVVAQRWRVQILVSSALNKSAVTSQTVKKAITRSPFMLYNQTLLCVTHTVLQELGFA